MQKLKHAFASPETIAISLSTLHLIIFCLILVNSPEELMAQYIPDDGYYYLTLARNFAKLHSWTFDSGVSVTSGFHLLFAYLLTLIFSALHPNPQKFIIYGVILNLFFSLTAITVLWRWGEKNKKEFFILFLALIISGKNFIYNTVSITEWAQTVFIAIVYHGYFFKNYESLPSNKTFVIFFTLGMLGSLSRTDFGLLPLSIFSATLIFLKSASRRQILFAAIGLSGAAAGVALSFLHNYLFTGELIQSSALVKAYWSELASPAYYAVPILIGQMLGNTGLAIIGLLLAFAIALKFSKSHAAQAVRLSDNQPNFSSSSEKTNASAKTTWILLASALICLSGYTLFYAHNADAQPWYTANLLTPVLALILLIANYLTTVIGDPYKKIIHLVFLIGLFLNIGNLYPLSFNKSPWAHQKFMFLAGNYLAQHKFECNIGAWNAGIIGYYQGGQVINLDGLVNNAIYPYLISNNLPKYIAEKNICYIVDFSYLLTEPQLIIRGGYNNPEFISSLSPQISFDENENIHSYLVLYHIH